MKGIANRLPHYLRVKWTDKSNDIIDRTGKEVKCKDLVDFVRKRASSACTSWGENLLNSTRKPGEKPKRDNTRASYARAAFATEVHATATSGDAKQQPRQQDDSYNTKCTSVLVSISSLNALLSMHNPWMTVVFSSGNTDCGTIDSLS